MRIQLPSGTNAELARPASGDASFGLVVFPDIMGLRPLFDDLCARLADENGWVVCAPEIFAGLEHLELDGRFAAAASLSDERVVGDAVAVAVATGADRVGVIGFCMGGMYTLKAAASGRFARAVSFYGMIRVPEPWRGPGQGEPLEALAATDDLSVLAIIGTEDTYTPPADVDALESVGAQVVRYQGCEHGFVHDPARPAHRPTEAADAWARAIEFLNG